MKSLLAFIMLFNSFTLMGQKFHTEFNYTDSVNNGISIQNSYPKGGPTYTDSNGKEYVYVIFWTSITNSTTTGLELTIDFPVESFIIPSSPDIDFLLYLPKETMTPETESLYNYGLDIQSYLDKNLNNKSSLTTTIAPNESYLFYVAALSSQGVNGVVRAGFELEQQDLIYKINGHTISCGSIIAKN